MKYGSRRPVVLQVREPSMGMIQLGKISQVYPSKAWAYLNNISAQMRKSREYAVAPCVVSLMRAWDIQLVYYYDSNIQGTYYTRLDDLLKNGKVKSYSYRPAYWHLGEGYWSRQAGQMKSKFTDDTLILDWEELVMESTSSVNQLAFSI